MENDFIVVVELSKHCLQVGLFLKGGKSLVRISVRQLFRLLRSEHMIMRRRLCVLYVVILIPAGGIVI